MSDFAAEARAAAEASPFGKTWIDLLYPEPPSRPGRLPKSADPYRPRSANPSVASARPRTATLDSWRQFGEEEDWEYESEPPPTGLLPDRSRAGLTSDVSLDFGMPMPSSSYTSFYPNPATRAFNPNKKAKGGSMNAHLMPTQVITGMAAAGTRRRAPALPEHMRHLQPSRPHTGSRGQTPGRSQQATPRATRPMSRVHTPMTSGPRSYSLHNAHLRAVRRPRSHRSVHIGPPGRDYVPKY
eukprot:TRINITY_DN10436_c0_g2_i1.p1 TRINITY_DN10436_c0_g2~~TRINITY_DN10436_c0_g2_i1.p1  ORF type:complete len:241 (-),score=9.17 TRINITY_DN10436_c0_g2_i1:239-961(-)